MSKFGSLIASLWLSLWLLPFGFSAEAAVTETIIHAFCQQHDCPDGDQPVGGLVQASNGDFFGVTRYGGNLKNAGTVFRLSFRSGRWVHSVLYSFCSQTRCADGRYPAGGLVIDRNGNLIGTTVEGGKKYGVAFMLSPSGSKWVYKKIYEFCSLTSSNNGCKDGGSPSQRLLIDASGALYGTTRVGGNQAQGLDYGDGTVFRLTPPATSTGKWSYRVLHTFCPKITDCPDGASASNGILPLVIDATGALYGTTPYGGAHYGGVLYRLSPTTTGGTTSWKFTVLYSFCAKQSWPGPCLDGSHPSSLALRNGDLYVLTEGGGTKKSGAAIRLSKPKTTTADWTNSVLYNFCTKTDCADGGRPIGAVAFDTAGRLYGTTLDSGPGGAYSNYGTAFRLTAPTKGTGLWALSTLHGFCTRGTYSDPCTDGAGPVGGVLRAADGYLYGETGHLHRSVYRLSGF